MTARVTRAIALALFAGLAATSAEAAQTAALQPCVTPEEARGLVLVMAPDALRAVGDTCAAALPRSALLRQPNGAFAARYQAAADAAWGPARAAIARLTGPQAAGIIDSQFARPMLAALLVPLLTKNVTARDCPTIDRVLTLIAPLPPRSAAELLVTFVQLSNDRRSDPGRRIDLPICPSDAPR